MKLKDFKVSDRKIYKVSRELKNIIDKELDNTVEEMKDILSTLNKEELIEYILLKNSYDKLENECYKVGDKFYKSRYYIEQIYHGNATAFYPSESEEDKKIVKYDSIDNNIEREFFYYYSDAGTIYRSYVEILQGVPYKNNPALPTYLSEVIENDEVLVEIVGIIPTHTNKIDLVSGIF